MVLPEPRLLPALHAGGEYPGLVVFFFLLKKKKKKKGKNVKWLRPKYGWVGIFHKELSLPKLVLKNLKVARTTLVYISCYRIGY